MQFRTHPHPPAPTRTHPRHASHAQTTGAPPGFVDGNEHIGGIYVRDHAPDQPYLMRKPATFDLDWRLPAWFSMTEGGRLTQQVNNEHIRVLLRQGVRDTRESVLRGDGPKSHRQLSNGIEHAGDRLRGCPGFVHRLRSRVVRDVSEPWARPASLGGPVKKLLVLGCSVLVASCTSLQQNNDSAIAAVTDDGEVERSINCNRCIDFRRLVIVNRAGGRCEVYYAKHGSAEKVADGDDPGACESVYERMSIDLATSGFDCR